MELAIAELNIKQQLTTDAEGGVSFEINAKPQFWDFEKTSPSAYRDQVVTDLVSLTHELDDTRLVGAAFDNVGYEKATSTFRIKDKVSQVVDVVGVNKYVGWYIPFQAEPEKIKWDVAADKPLIMTEFSCEALYGQHPQPARHLSVGVV